MANSERTKHLRELIAGIDQQINDAEATLLHTVHLDDIRKIVDRMANLKVAKQNLELTVQREG